jgi:hypothetical protein
MSMNTIIIPERLAEVTRLDNGAHDNASDGMCAMEAASFIAGEPWSDHQVNGAIKIDDDTDQEAIDAIEAMDEWLSVAREIVGGGAS